MRAKAIFSVFARKLPSGKRVFYYQCYDDSGKRQWAKSTGKTKKTEATAYCMKLFRDGLLIPEQKVPTFAEFSEGWWDIETCRYLKWRQLHDPLTKGSIYIHKSNFTHHIKDYFAKYRLDDITPNAVEGWLLSLSESGLKPKSINLIYITLKMMLKEAAKAKLIKSNPCGEVKKLKADEIVRAILTVEEARKLFPANWATVWESKVVYLAHRLAACTGLRIGELLGLRGEYVFDRHIYVCGQYGDGGYLPYTKTKENRNIPLIPEIIALLRGLKNGNGFVFSLDGGAVPVTQAYVRKAFHQALKKIGINEAEIKRRAITIHGWRHFLNTELLKQGLTVMQVQGVTGHKSDKMTEMYNHPSASQINDVMKAQATIAGTQKPEKEKKPKETEKAKTGQKALAIVKMPRRKSA